MTSAPRCRYLMMNGNFCTRSVEEGELLCSLCRKKRGVYQVSLREKGKETGKALLHRVNFPVYWDPRREVLLVNVGGTTQVLGGWSKGTFLPMRGEGRLKKRVSQQEE